MKLLVLDIGGTAIKYSVMDENMAVLTSGSKATPLDSQESFLQVVKTIHDENGDGCEGIAISMPGMIDSDNGICHTGGMLEFNQGKPVAKQISEMCGCPVHIENDGKCAAFAEYTVGALQGCQNAAVFLIGTGAGGGLIIDGKLVKGKHFSAGEYSFLSRGLNEWGTLEGLMGYSAAIPGFLAKMREAKGMSNEEPLDGRIAFKMINEGDEVAQKVLDDFTYGIAHQLYNFQMLLDLEKVAFGGGICREPKLMESIQNSFDRLLENEYVGLKTLVSQTCEFVRCKFGNEANQIGAFQGYLEWKSRGLAV